MLYERSYQAAAKVISTIDTLMGNVLDMGVTRPGVLNYESQSQLHRRHGQPDRSGAAGRRTTQPSNSAPDAASTCPPTILPPKPPWSRKTRQSAAVDQYTANSDSLTDVLNTGDSTLSSVVTLLQQAVSLGVEGANGTNNQTDLNSIAAQVSGIQSQMLSLANTSYAGQYLFAGTATRNRPLRRRRR